MDKKVYLETLGCSKNRVDSEIMLGSLNSQGYQFTDDAEEAEVIIVNTCGFLSAASQESITRILELSDLKQEGRCLLYTSPSPRDLSTSRMPSSA